MKETKENKTAYDKLTPERKQLVDMVLENLEKEDGLWTKGWRMPGAPESAITGKKYRGVNNFFLTLIGMSRNYADNRWLTFHQMEEKDWHFKTDEEGNGLGKGAGVSIEFFELRDKKTKQRFDRHTLDGMTADEKDEYEQDNIYPVRKYYRVFNGDIIDGIPEREKNIIDLRDKQESAEKIIAYWDENESKIIYGGHSAHYSISEDTIYLPERDEFYSLAEFYGTTLHEIGHSTGHESRLKRDIENKFGSSDYAQEELRAEIASMFLVQDLEVEMGESHIQNNSQYIKGWKEEIRNNPDALFAAIADADKIAKYVITQQQKAEKKEVEPYAIEIGVDEYSDSTYKLYMCASHGLLTAPFSYAFSSREALKQEFEKMQKLPLWTDKDFKEVDMQMLFAMSEERAKTEEAVAEKSEVFVKPSEVAEKSFKERKAVDMSGKGVDSLTRMCDREVVERAEKTRNGEKFSALYNGLSVLGNEEKDERSLMARLAMFCSGDKEKLLKVFQSSGQYSEDKPSEFYENMAEQSMQFIAQVKGNSKNQGGNIGSGKARLGANAKS